MARIDEHGERIPLTVADFNVDRGTVTVVIQAVGKTTFEMMGLREGDTLLDFIGPLGLPSDIRKLEGTVVLVGGGLGVAPIYPQLREYKLRGNRTISIVGFRNRDLMFWEDEFRAYSDELLVTSRRRNDRGADYRYVDFHAVRFREYRAHRLLSILVLI